MRFSTTIFSVAATTALAFASTTVPLQAVEKYKGNSTGRFIVKFKDDVSKASFMQRLKVKPVSHEWQILNGFAADLDTADLNLLRSSSEVELISEDGIMHTTAVVNQTNATWGLARLSSSTKLSNQNPSSSSFSYIYDSSGGAGVDIYIILVYSNIFMNMDVLLMILGVSILHTEFGGRARWGATFGGYADADGNGHGTYCAGLAAGNQYGVAKKANIVAVKVLSDAGSGAVSDIISGLNFVASSARASGRPSVACIPLSGGASTALDNTISALTAAGVHVAVPAGNSNVDASTTSPGRAPSAVTVGASTIVDARATFSNFGSVVDIFASGQNAIGPWIGGSTITNNLSGTSPATCYVAGLIAYLIGLNGNTTPAEMSEILKSLSLKGVIGGLPSSTPNNLAHNTL
ncbi:serine protease [Collybia nuda]|uniref:Serine protease n=1 Tax=Collybia nuda TaxID=64659 RepID=A0A9P5XZL4_9AGAR|nr:serine protease [Collybia nuda]